MLVSTYILKFSGPEVYFHVLSRQGTNSMVTTYDGDHVYKTIYTQYTLLRRLVLTMTFGMRCEIDNDGRSWVYKLDIM